MRIALHAVALTVLAVAMPAVSRAQSAPNLTGSWALEVDKSDFGMMPGPQRRVDVIDHQEPKLTIKRTVVAGAAGEATTNLAYAVDGKPHKNTVGPNEVTSTLKWEGQTLVMVSTLTSPQGEITITDRISVAADGKTMTQARTFSVQGQEVKQTLSFAKQ